MEELTGLPTLSLQRRGGPHTCLVREWPSASRETATSALRGSIQELAVQGLEGLQALSPRRWPPLGAFIKPPALRVVHDLRPRGLAHQSVSALHRDVGGRSVQCQQRGMLCMRPPLRANMAKATFTPVGFPEEYAKFLAAASYYDL